MTMCELIRLKLENGGNRSAWRKGVNAYAFDIAVKDIVFDRVEISRKRIGWLFGARFPLDDFEPKYYN